MASCTLQPSVSAPAQVLANRVARCRRTRREHMARCTATPRRGIHARHADAARLRPDAGQDGRARPEREQPLQERADVAVVMRLTVFQPGQQAGLRDVRRDEVSLRAERAEHGGEVRLQPGIQRAVVGHDGVHEPHGGEAREEVERLIHLSPAAEIAGIDHVELQAELLQWSATGVSESGS